MFNSKKPLLFFEYMKTAQINPVMRRIFYRIYMSSGCILKLFRSLFSSDCRIGINNIKISYVRNSNKRRNLADYPNHKTDIFIINFFRKSDIIKQRTTVYFCIYIPLRRHFNHLHKFFNISGI